MASAKQPGYPIRRRSALKDPVVLALVILIFGVIIATLVFLMLSLTRGYIGSNTPTTAAQAELAKTEGYLNNYGDEPEVWAGYISNLIAAKQYSRAQEAINAAASEFKDVDNYENYIPTAQAQLFASKGDYDKAIQQAELAQTAIMDAYETMLKSDVKPNKALAYGIPENYDRLNLILANSYSKKEQYDKSVEHLEDYLERYPTSAGIWIDLGHAYAKLGNTQKAIEAYDEALVFLPGDEEALQGKASLGAK